MVDWTIYYFCNIFYCSNLRNPPLKHHLWGVLWILDMHLHRSSKSTSLFRNKNSIIGGSIRFFWALICWFWSTSFFLYSATMMALCVRVFFCVINYFRSVRYKMHVISARSSKFFHRKNYRQESMVVVKECSSIFRIIIVSRIWSAIYGDWLWLCTLFLRAPRNLWWITQHGDVCSWMINQCYLITTTVPS